MSDCPYKNSVVPYLDGEVTADERERFEAHLETCEVCADDFEAFAAIGAALKEWTPPIAEPERTPRTWFSMTQQPAWSFALAATLVVIVVTATGVNLWPRPSGGPPSEDSASVTQAPQISRVFGDQSPDPGKEVMHVLSNVFPGLYRIRSFTPVQATTSRSGEIVPLSADVSDDSESDDRSILSLSRDGRTEPEVDTLELQVSEEAVEAEHGYREAAGQGNADAQYNLGVMYYTGEGVPEDAVEAVRWFRLAAEQGDALAQISLGLSYALGEGVSQDDAEAVRWLTLAASGMTGEEQGAADSIRELVRDEAFLSDLRAGIQQLKEARRLLPR
jgi:hypothetical protein